MKLKAQTLWVGAVLLLAAAAVHVIGGDLNPDNTPSPTMRTLDELYKNIQPGLPSDWIPYPVEPQVTDHSAIHLSLETSQNPIPGSVRLREMENTIRIVGLGHQIELPYDIGSGHVTGQPEHGAIIVTKYTDKSSPLLYKALLNNEMVTLAELKFYRTNAAGQQEHYYTIRLEQGRLIKIQTAFPNIEQIHIAYQSIRWTWEPDGIEFQDTISNGGV